MLHSIDFVESGVESTFDYVELKVWWSVDEP